MDTAPIWAPRLCKRSRLGKKGLTVGPTTNFNVFGWGLVGIGRAEREIQNNQAWDNPHTATSKVENKFKTPVDKKFVHAENKPREGAKPKLI